MSRNDVRFSATSLYSCSVLIETRYWQEYVESLLMNVSRISPLLVSMFFLKKNLIGLLLSISRPIEMACDIHMPHINFIKHQLSFPDECIRTSFECLSLRYDWCFVHIRYDYILFESRSFLLARIKNCKTQSYMIYHVGFDISPQVLKTFPSKKKKKFLARLLWNCFNWNYTLNRQNVNRY